MLKRLSVVVQTALVAASVGVVARPAPRASARRIQGGPTLTVQHSGTTQRLQAVSPVDARIVWASGTGGTFVVTMDGGATWRAGVVPGAQTLQFRDVQGVSATEAYLLSSGAGADSRIYKTEDGGGTWTLEFKNRDPKAFYDCFAFWTPRRGIAISDSVDGRFPTLETVDGRTWRDVGSRLPAARPGEASFAASGTCVAILGAGHAWIVTGGAKQSRILATADGGATWAAYDAPVGRGTASSGVTTVAFRDADHGMLGGGDVAAHDTAGSTTARTADGGRTWRPTSRPPFPGAVYGMAYAVDRVREPRRTHGSRSSESAEHLVAATGPGGTAWSADEGDTWHALPGVENYWSVAFANRTAGWLVGTEGRILKIAF